MSPRSPIGYVLKMFPRLSETFIRNEILELERQGLEVRIFSLKKPVESERRMIEGKVRAQIVYLPERVFKEPFRVFWAQLSVLMRYPGGYFRTGLHVLARPDISALAKHFRRFCQTCCLVHDLRGVRHLHAHFANDPARVASWARMLCGISYSVTTHAKDLYQEDRIRSPALRYKLSRARFVVTNSQFSAAGLRASFDEETAPKIVTIRNSVDLSAFPQRSGEADAPLILSAGRLIEKKGFADLIGACGILKQRGVPFKCEIIGAGPLRDKLQEEIIVGGLEQAVSLCGQMSQQDLRICLSKAMVFALPCVAATNGDRDILPNVLKEAMATGVPVVTTRLGGIEELITDNESGLLVPPEAPKALAEALARLLSDATLRGQLAARARKVIEEHFDLRKNFTQLRALLLQCMDETSSETDSFKTTKPTRATASQLTHLT